MEFVTAKPSIVELLNTSGHTTAASGAAPGKLAQPILIRGSLGGGEDATLHPQRTEALVINVRKLPANAVLQLDNVGFAILLARALSLAARVATLSLVTPVPRPSS